MGNEDALKYFGVYEVIKIPAGVYKRVKKHLYQCPGWLYCHYILLRESTVKIAKSQNTNTENIQYWLKKFKIKTRTISEANKGRILTVEWKMKISQAMKGENHPGWKGGIKKRKKGYTDLYKPDHPFTKQDGYIKEHRFVMEQHLGRYLTPEERVHHINGVKHDNRIENLILFPNESEHQKYHQCILKIKEGK